MSKIYTSADQLIGHTPLLELTHIEKNNGLEAKVLAKLEYLNPAGSVKDRIAKAMLDDAEQRGLLKPGALILAYPIVQYAEVTPAYRLGVDGLSCGKFYYEYSVADVITEDYPPVYFWYGKNDTTLMMLCWNLQEPALAKALQANQVPHKQVVYNDAPHGIGLGRGTDAEGWLNDAVAFWEAQTT